MVKPVTSDRNFEDLSAFTRTGAAGDVIFKQGDAAPELFVVQAGRVELVREPAGVPVGVIEAGEVFGEWSFFEGQSRDVTARGLTDFRLVALDRGAFDQVTGEAPALAIWMMQKLARLLHERLPSGKAAPAPAPVPVPMTAPEPAAPAAVPDAKPAKPPEKKSARAGSARLVEETSGTEFTLAVPDATVGRLDRSTGFTPEVDLTALDTDRTLSRRHARILQRDGAYFVREQGSSRNGTFVNGQRLAAGQEVELHDGDEVRFGLVKTTFRWR